MTMMKYYVTYLKTRFGSKKGQGMVEYGLILALIAVAVVVAVGALGGQLGTLFNSIKTSLSGTTATT